MKGEDEKVYGRKSKRTNLGWNEIGLERERMNQTKENQPKRGRLGKISRTEIESLLDFDLPPPIGGQANQNQ